MRFQRSIQGPSRTSMTEMFLQKYLAASTIRYHFHKMLHHRTGSLIRLPEESKLKRCSAKFEDGKIASYVLTLYTIVPSSYIASQRYFKFQKLLLKFRFEILLCLFTFLYFQICQLLETKCGGNTNSTLLSGLTSWGLVGWKVKGSVKLCYLEHSTILQDLIWGANSRLQQKISFP